MNPLGAKGIGEAGTIGSTPAVQNAVIDAVAHLGVRHVDMPTTPMRVWRAIQQAVPRSAGGQLMQVSITVNGEQRTDEVEPRLLLAHYLREARGLRATNIGCDSTSCGACTVIVDGLSVKSCTVLAAQADGSQVTTLEGLAGPDGELHPVQAAFRAEHGLQCGFCTPGMVMAAIGVLADNPRPDRPGGPGGAGGQPLPLHRLPQHRPRGPAAAARPGAAGAGGGGLMTELARSSRWSPGSWERRAPARSEHDPAPFDYVKARRSTRRWRPGRARRGRQAAGRRALAAADHEAAAGRSRRC